MSRLVFDYREKGLIDLMAGADFQVRNLDIGDILIETDSGVPLCLIERKTVSDYVASIADKRSNNQALRIKSLKEQYPDLRVIYLVEGAHISPQDRFRGGVTGMALISSMLNRIVLYGFSIFRTAHLEETVQVIKKLISKYQTSREIPEYVETLKLAKKDQMTPQICFQCQLAQIPGVSLKIADKISQEYPNMRSLIDALEKGRTTSLTHLELEGRKLGPVLSNRIYTYLLGTKTQPKLKLCLKK